VLCATLLVDNPRRELERRRVPYVLSVPAVELSDPSRVALALEASDRRLWLRHEAPCERPERLGIERSFKRREPRAFLEPHVSLEPVGQHVPLRGQPFRRELRESFAQRGVIVADLFSVSPQRRVAAITERQELAIFEREVRRELVLEPLARRSSQRGAVFRQGRAQRRRGCGAQRAR
jgi:hypothetical protein